MSPLPGTGVCQGNFAASVKEIFFRYTSAVSLRLWLLLNVIPL
jgi:hypothetical protein